MDSAGQWLREGPVEEEKTTVKIGSAAEAAKVHRLNI